MYTNFAELFETALQAVRFDVWAIVLFSIAVLLHTLKGKTVAKLISFTILRNLFLVISIWFLTGTVKMMGFSDYLWLFLAAVAGLLDGFIERTIIPYKKRVVSNIAKFKEHILGLDVEKRKKLRKMIHSGLYASYLSLLWPSLLMLLIIAGIWFIIWRFGIIPYRHTASLILIFFALNKIRRYWTNQWAWVDCCVKMPAAFASLHLPAVPISANQRRKHIARFFYLNTFIFLTFLLLLPKFLGDESAFGLLIQYFGFTGTLLFLSILVLLILRFLGKFSYSKKFEFIWSSAITCLFGVLLSGFVAIFLHSFLG
jgi:hypothetical protein